MKKVYWLILLLLIILLLILLRQCNRRSDSGDVRLGLGPVGYSLWSDGSLAVAIPIMNSGNRAAADVKVTAVTLGSGNRVTPAALPIPLGEIVPTRRAVLDARFASLAAPGKYLLTVSGTYALDGKSHPFTTQTDLPVERSGGPPSPPAQINAPKQKTTGVPTPPSPIEQENDNNPAGRPFQMAQC